jgi:hypothetical protein
MKISATLLFSFLVLNTLAQNEANNWFYGHFGGITFNTIPPVALPGGQTQIGEGSSTISDAAGNLLFYSDGIKVWDKNHAVMPNGTGLNGNASSTQSCLIIPVPDNERQYYVFTAPDYSTGLALEYSIVDMNLNGGNGDVTSIKNVVLLPNSTEKLTAVEHSNGKDVWVIGHLFESADFYAWQVTPTGILPPVISTSGTPHASNTIDWNSNQNAIGVMKVSPCGDRLACTVLYDSFLELFDFNNSTGVVSNPQMLGTWPGLFPWGIYGVEFSAGCTKLYATSANPSFLLQYDLTAGSPSAIAASVITIATSTTDYFGTVQNGPDGLMYLAKAPNTFLGCITQPELPGITCAFDEFYVSGTGMAIYGLPNFITSWFRTVTTSVDDKNKQQDFFLYYEPTTSQIYFSSDYNLKGTTEIVNATGQIVSLVKMNGSQATISMENAARGIYFFRWTDGEECFNRKFMRQ